MFAWPDTDCFPHLPSRTVLQNHCATPGTSGTWPSSSTALASRQEERAGLPGAVPSAHPGTGGVPVAGGGHPNGAAASAARFRPGDGRVLRPAHPARRPSWRKAGRAEGFRIVGQRGKQWHLRRLSRKTGEVWVPKVGWVRFRWSRPVPPGVKSYRVTMDRTGRWHVAFAAMPGPDSSTGGGRSGRDRPRRRSIRSPLDWANFCSAPGLTVRERQRRLRLQRRLARAKRGSHRRAG